MQKNTGYPRHINIQCSIAYSTKKNVVWRICFSCQAFWESPQEKQCPYFPLNHRIKILIIICSILVFSYTYGCNRLRSSTEDQLTIIAVSAQITVGAGNRGGASRPPQRGTFQRWIGFRKWSRQIHPRRLCIFQGRRFSLGLKEKKGFYFILKALSLETSSSALTTESKQKLNIQNHAIFT